MNWDELPDNLRHAIDDHLTVTQAQAFVLALYGLNSSQAGRAMNINPSSAKTYLDEAVRKLLDAGYDLPYANMPPCATNPSANTHGTSPATDPIQTFSFNDT